MHGRTDIVRETGEGERRASEAASGYVIRLNDARFEPGLREDDGCRQSIRTGADDNNVVGRRQIVSLYNKNVRRSSLFVRRLPG